MSKSTNDKIEEIWLMRPDDFPEEYKATKQLIKETLQECLGEEEEAKVENWDCHCGTSHILTTEYHQRNQLRQEAYKKLEELIND